MDADFALQRRLVQHSAPHPVLVHRAALLLHASFRLASRLPPCASLTLHLHQVGWKTFTSELSSMLGTRWPGGVSPPLGIASKISLVSLSRRDASAPFALRAE